MKIPHLLPFALGLLLAVSPLRAHEAEQEMAAAAKNFLVALTPEQRDKARFEFNTEERKNWHFVPRERKGLPIKEMTQEQRLLVQALLATGLSNRGYAKAASIMSLEEVLATIEGDTEHKKRNPEMYFVSIFGTPGGTDPWGWRFEGHHLSLNFTSNGAAAPSLTPSFFGTNPGEVRTGQRAGTRVLGAEEELGRTLVKMLTEEQRKVAIINATAPKEVVNAPGRVDPTKPEGIAQGKLTAEQQAALTKLVKEYLFSRRPDVATEEWAKLERVGLGQLYFAWAGGVERGEPHYYRVQGGNFVLEYDNTQNDANHVHALWRDFDHDFGGDLLKAHLDSGHQAP